MERGRRLLIAALSVLVLAGAATPASAQPPGLTPFVSGAPFAHGIAIDRAANVLLTYDATFSTQLAKLSAAGQVLGTVPTGGITVGGLGALATDPATGLVWSVTTTGELRVIDPATLQVQELGRLREIVTDARAVYDVLTTTFRDMTGLLLTDFGTGLTPGSSTFGDIALLRSAGNQRLDVFVTARTTANVRSVLRLTFVNDRFQPPARAVISSSAISAFFDVAPAVAVNPAGVAVTTLTDCTGAIQAGLCPDVSDFAFAFPANLPEAPRGPRPRRVSAPSISSTGAATDGAGLFYLASQVLGSAACGDVGASGIAVLLLDGRYLGCHKFAPSLPVHDISVAPGGELAYLTVKAAGGAGGVVRVGRLAAGLALPGAPPAAPAPPPAQSRTGPGQQDLRALRIRSRALRARRGVVRVVLRNPNRVAVRARVSLRRRGIALGSARVTVAAGRTATARVRLTARGRRLARRGDVRVTLAVVAGGTRVRRTLPLSG